MKIQSNPAISANIKVNTLVNDFNGTRKHDNYTPPSSKPETIKAFADAIAAQTTKAKPTDIKDYAPPPPPYEAPEVKAQEPETEVERPKSTDATVTTPERPKTPNPTTVLSGATRKF